MSQYIIQVIQNVSLPLPITQDSQICFCRDLLHEEDWFKGHNGLICNMVNVMESCNLIFLFLITIVLGFSNRNSIIASTMHCENSIILLFISFAVMCPLLSLYTSSRTFLTCFRQGWHPLVNFFLYGWENYWVVLNFVNMCENLLACLTRSLKGLEQSIDVFLVYSSVMMFLFLKAAIRFRDNPCCSC